VVGKRTRESGGGGSEAVRGRKTRAGAESHHRRPVRGRTLPQRHNARVETFAKIADERRGLADLLTRRSVALDHLVGEGVATLRSRMA